MRILAVVGGRLPSGPAGVWTTIAAGCVATVLGALAIGGPVRAAEAARTPAPPVGGDGLDDGRGPRALIAFLPTAPAPGQPLLADLAKRSELAIGLTSPSVGGYTKRQTVLDMSQGARITSRGYPTPLERLDLTPVGRAGRMQGWEAARRRAEEASGEAVPGLLATTVERARGRVAYAGQIGLEQIEAAVAADETGRIPRVSLGTTGTFARRALELWDVSDLLVARLPEGEDGLEVLDALLAARRADDLVFVMRAPPRAARLLPTGIAGPGLAGSFRSETTRRDGLVAASDVAPTVLQHLGLPVPPAVQGRPIVAVPEEGAAAAADLSARLTVIIPRREAALRWTFIAWLAAFAVLAVSRRGHGVRAALRIGFLGALWLPGLALLTSALEPTQEAELAIIALGGLALGIASDRLMPWPGAPALPAAVVLLAHAIDLAAGSALIAGSLAGPNPRGGARFYGLGNELETILAVSVLLGTGAAWTLLAARRPRWAPRAFAMTCLLAAVIIGAGRLGAAVGGVITLGAGGAAAVLACLPGGLTRRRVGIAVAAPVAALAALILIDLATGGGAHLTRSVVDADSAGDLIDIVRRRFELSFAGLVRGTTPVSVGVAALLLAIGVIRRREVLRPLDSLSPAAAGAFRAGLTGALVATVVGALANDSGPVIFLIGAGSVVLAVGYLNGRPGAPAPRSRPSRSPAEPSVAGGSSTIARCV